MSDLGNSLYTAVTAAPDLQNSPSLAVAAAQTTDPASSAQALAQATNTASQGAAVTHVAAKHSGGWLQRIVGDLEHVVYHTPVTPMGAIDFGMRQANAGLHEVTHQYRYLQDVAQHHGILPAIGEGLGIAAGSAVGGLAGSLADDPTQGAVLGAEIAGGIEGRLTYHDSWNRTKVGAIDPTTGKPEYQHSPGRDLANAVGLRASGGVGTGGFWLSGLGDALFAFAADPAAQAMGAAKGATAANYALEGVTAVQRADDLTRLAASRLPNGFQRLTADLASHDAGYAVTRYPRIFNDLPNWVAPAVGRAQSAGEVTDVFRNLIAAGELVGPAPNIGLTRTAFHSIDEFIRNYDGPASGAFDAARRSFTSIPVTTDPVARKLTNLTSDASRSAEFANSLFHVARYNLSDEAATQIANDAATAADAGQRLVIQKNALVSMAQAMGFPDDQVLRNMLGSSFDDVLRDYTAYGANVRGENLSQAIDQTTGNTVSAGILLKHRGRTPIFQLNQFRDAVAQVSKLHNAGREIDNITFERIMTPWKQLVLASPATAERLAISEALPNFMRDPKGVVDAALNTTLTKWDLKSQTGDLGFAKLAVLKALQGTPLSAANADRVAFTSDLIGFNGGLTRAPEVDAAHVLTGEQVGARDSKINQVFKWLRRRPDPITRSDTWTMTGPNATDHATRWGQWLGDQSQDPMTKTAAEAYGRVLESGGTQAEASQAGAVAVEDYLRANNVSFMMRATRVASDPNADPISDYARTIVENMRGATHSPEVYDSATDTIVRQPVPNLDLINNVASGTVTPHNVLADIPVEDRPLGVPNQELVHVPDSGVEKIANLSWKYMLGPIINHLSRDPMYNRFAWDGWAKYIRPLVDEGVLTREEGLAKANEYALNQMIPFIHNPADRSQFAVMVRNWMPFYFAQTQAYRRYGRLMLDDPAAFRRFGIVTGAITNPAASVKDANGRQFLAIPGTGFLSPGVQTVLSQLGVTPSGVVPVGFSGQARSLQTIFPFSEGMRPSVGPLVTVAGHILMNIDPAATPLVTSIVGPAGAAGSVWDQIIPNAALRTLVQAVGPAQLTHSMQNSQLYAIQSLNEQQIQAMDVWRTTDAYRQWMSDPSHTANDPNAPGRPNIVPTSAQGPAWQTFLDRVNGLTRINWMLKAIVGFVSPLAPTINVGEYGIRKQVTDVMQKDGFAGVDALMTQHPDWTPYDVFLTKNQLGVAVPATVPGMDWYNAHAGLVGKYPAAAAWFIPQTADPFAQPAFNQQLAAKLRLEKTPTEFQNDLYIAAGNALYYNRDLPAYEQAQATAKGFTLPRRADGSVDNVRYRDLLAQSGGADANVRTDWNNYLTNVLGPQNPIWWDDFKSTTRLTQRQQAVAQMQQMAQAGDLPDSPLSRGIVGLLKDYNTYQQVSQPGTTGMPAVASKTAAREDWQAYLDGIATSHPELAPVINGLFRSL